MHLNKLQQEVVQVLVDHLEVLDLEIHLKTYLVVAVDSMMYVHFCKVIFQFVYLM